MEGFSVVNGKATDTSGGGGVLLTKHVVIRQSVLGGVLQDGPNVRLGSAESITFHMWLRVAQGQRAASIFQLGSTDETGFCAAWKYMISLEMTYPPGDSNGYLNYWVSNENVSNTTSVYSSQCSEHFPVSTWVQLVIIHTQGKSVFFYIDGQNIAAKDAQAAVFPPDIYRNALNFNSGRVMSGLHSNCMGNIDDLNAWSMSDFYIWNR
jgi:hypothetical protein